eukprot:gnl/Spiro4/22808_TR11238_c0_g2_i2.p1 gnl/Spiro4/22808_TR11238_c0_g2~~gnl/Spiro4/22808_TR11238_c0_g2_i2.p1  ORF type:complete len:431 (-),score=123.50 gnl/Spiro4/22808_TR11238_c0_g2_i2:43-1335(-)
MPISKSNTLAEIRQKISAHLCAQHIYDELDPDRIRLCAPSLPLGFLFNAPKILKGQDIRLVNALPRNMYSRTGSKKLQIVIDIRDEPERFDPDDKILTVQLFQTNGEFGPSREIACNRNATIGELKQLLSRVFGVPVERQLLSEWYSCKVHRLFKSHTDTLAQAQIRQSDVLRLDVVEDPRLNIAPITTANICLQLVKILAYELGPYERDVQTTIPCLITLPSSLTTVGDLRTLISARSGVPAEFIELLVCHYFPIIETYMQPLNQATADKNAQRYAWNQSLRWQNASGLASLSGYDSDTSKDTSDSDTVPPGAQGGAEVVTATGTGTTLGGGFGFQPPAASPIAPALPENSGPSPMEVTTTAAPVPVISEPPDEGGSDRERENGIPLTSFYLQDLHTVCWFDARAPPQEQKADASKKYSRKEEGVKIKN